MKRTRYAVATAAGVAMLLLATSGCSDSTSPSDPNVHGGPDNPAPDGSYTEAIVSPNGIASLEPVTLGGVQQWLLIRGYDVDNPVLIFLHGGPGSPAIHYARFAFSGLERHFTVVTWDQRGCGKSYSAGIDPQSLTFQRMLSDTHELVTMMRARFGVERVYLMGISWGSTLGAITARDYPELIHAYVGIGQAVNLVRSYGVALQVALARATDDGVQEAIDDLTPLLAAFQTDSTVNWDQAGQLFDWLEVFGYGDLHDLSLYETLAEEAGALTEYTAQDFANEDDWQALYSSAPLFTDLAFWNDLDMIGQVPRIEVPVFFFAGEYDYKTPIVLVEEYLATLDAPAGKQLVRFENSAHVPFLEERVAFRNAMINTVLVGATAPSVF
jgi:pimeloyl-ACP methyl ester carboxylesterase